MKEPEIELEFLPAKKKWTAEKQAMLERYHNAGMSVVWIAKKIKARSTTIKRRIMILRGELKEPNRRAPWWTPAEDEILRKHCIKGERLNVKTLVRLLPGRSHAAVTNRLCNLGLRNTCKWTPKKTDRIRGVIKALSLEMDLPESVLVSQIRKMRWRRVNYGE